MLLARRLLPVAELEQGALVAAEEQADAYERPAHRIGSPRYGWLPEIWRGMRALLDGDPDRALRHADAAEKLGKRAASFNAELIAFTVRTQAHLDRGTPGEYVADTIALMDRIGLHGDAGHVPRRARPRPARRRRPDPGPGGAACVPGRHRRHPARDAEWVECHWAMVDLAIALDDRPAADGLFAALLPYQALWAVDGIGDALFGTVPEQLGRLAGYLGRPAEAAGFLATARERYARAGAPALQARLDTPPVGSSTVRATAATAPGDTAADSSGAHEAAAGAVAGRTERLWRDGKVWFVRWRGRRSAVPDGKGMRDLSVPLTGQAGRCRPWIWSRPAEARPRRPPAPTSGRCSTRQRGGRTRPGWTGCRMSRGRAGRV